MSKWEALRGYRTDLLVLHLVQDEEVTVWVKSHCYFPRLHWSVSSDALQGSDWGVSLALPPSKWVLSIQGRRWLWMKPWDLTPYPVFPNDAVFLGDRKSLRSLTLSFGCVTLSPNALLSPQADTKPVTSLLSLTLAPYILHFTQACPTSLSVRKHCLFPEELCRLLAGRVSGFSWEEVSPPANGSEFWQCRSQVLPVTSDNNKKQWCNLLQHAFLPPNQYSSYRLLSWENDTVDYDWVIQPLLPGCPPTWC